MKKYILILPIIALLVSSCANTALALYNAKSPMQRKCVWQKDDRTIIFLQMIHLSKQAYYDEVKEFITQKRKEGYVIYYEGIGSNKELAEQQRDTLLRKFRKIYGFNLFAGTSYKDNPSYKYNKSDKYVGQTLENIGIDPEVDVNADLSLREIITQLETKIGVIELDSCDFSTPLDKIYQCKRVELDKYYRFTMGVIREDYVNELLMKSTDKKIILVYGLKHRTFIDACIAHKMKFKLVEGKSIAAKVEKKK